MSLRRLHSRRSIYACVDFGTELGIFNIPVELPCVEANLLALISEKSVDLIAEHLVLNVVSGVFLSHSRKHGAL